MLLKGGEVATPSTPPLDPPLGVVPRSATDWTTFFGKIRTEFAAREKSPGLFPGKSPFRVNMRGLVAGDCPLSVTVFD